MPFCAIIALYPQRVYLWIIYRNPRRCGISSDKQGHGGQGRCYLGISEGQKGSKKRAAVFSAVNPIRVFFGSQSYTRGKRGPAVSPPIARPPGLTFLHALRPPHYPHFLRGIPSAIPPLLRWFFSFAIPSLYRRYTAAITVAKPLLLRC